MDSSPAEPPGEPAVWISAQLCEFIPTAGAQSWPGYKPCNCDLLPPSWHLSDGHNGITSLTESCRDWMRKGEHDVCWLWKHLWGLACGLVVQKVWVITHTCAGSLSCWKLSSLLSKFATPLHSQELMLHHSCLPVKTGCDQKSAPLLGKKSPGLGPQSCGWSRTKPRIVAESCDCQLSPASYPMLLPGWKLRTVWGPLGKCVYKY